jgi:hypothetical protein
MLAEMYPDFDKSKEKKKKTYQKRLQRHIKYGRMEYKLLGISPSLLLTVAPVLNSKE